jgi:subtilisin family serine protease
MKPWPRVVATVCRHAALVTVALSLSAVLLPVSPAAEPAVPASRRILESLTQTLARDTNQRTFAAVAAPDAVCVVLHLEFTSPAACDAFAGKAKGTGCHVFARLGEFADVMLPRGDASALKTLQDNAGELRAWDPGGPVVVPPPPRRVPPQVPRGPTPPQPIVRGGVGDLKGKDVLVAVIDTGIDFRHPDFITQVDGKPTSRLLYLWDTLRAHEPGVGAPGPITFPNSQPVGTIYSRDDLTADLRGEKKLDVGDDEGHGTACAGVAAGGGKAQAEAVGVAPEADLIAVRIGSKDQGVANAVLLNAIGAWLDKVATRHGRPLVASCSFGGHDGAPHGKRVDERHLSKLFAADRPGRIICIAAGNEGYRNIHTAVTFKKDEPALVTWNARVGGGLQIYLGKAQPGDVEIRPAQDTHVEVPAPSIHLLTGGLIYRIELPKGKGGLYLGTPRDGTFAADAYLPNWQEEERSIQFTSGLAVNLNQVASPASALGAIAVGSYDFDDRFSYQGRLRSVPNLRTLKPLQLGALSDYSNAGYVHEGAVKPEITGPGRYFTAPAPDKVKDLIRDTTDRYQLFDGTSAATPYVAGVVALLLRKDHNLTAERFRGLMQKYATRDDETGTCPNPSWGHGKLDLDAVKRMIKALP